jgi:hypothetical protein
MAIFSHTYAFQPATPVDFRPGLPGADYLPAIPPKLARSWSTDSHGDPVCRWRAIAKASAH